MSASVETINQIGTNNEMPMAHVKVFAHAPFSDAVLGNNKDAVLPYSARVASPIRVRYTPNPNAMKQESRVGQITRSATFSFRPLKPGDKPMTPTRVRPPDATLPTLLYASPWLSVTKADFKDPKSQLDDDAVRCLLGQSFFRRRPPDSIEIGSSLKTETPQSSSRMDATSPTKTISCVKSEPVSRAISQMSTTKSVASDKRVTIKSPSNETNNFENNGTIAIETLPLPSPPPKSPPRSSSKTARFPRDTSVNYYSGYLPPELEFQLAEQLKIKRSKSMLSSRPSEQLLPNGKTYKPLIGDRSLFMREPYPIQPKVYQSEIEQQRFEGHNRLRKSNGQAQAHFSALNNKQTIMKPSLAEHKGFRFGPPQKAERRHPQVLQRNPIKQSSIDMFQLQRERTYVLQDMAREMLKK